MAGVIKGLQREDRYEIPMEAIREVILNAYVHRDYINLGRDIKVGIYDDIVIFVSPEVRVRLRLRTCLQDALKIEKQGGCPCV
ncbi:MAG: hypothetical protein V8R91_06125 [Butyricimonas faecihominis]